MEEEKKELEKIEHKNRNWTSSFMREQSIWDEISMNINSYTGKDQEYWFRVMDLYKEKYRQLKQKQ
jgi:hypothetical protein